MKQRRGEEEERDVESQGKERGKQGERGEEHVENLGERGEKNAEKRVDNIILIINI